jgi:riboflavin synthase
MFTGIVQEIGSVTAVDHGADGSVLHVRMTDVGEGLRIGDSVSVDGCCLTATAIADGMVAFEAMQETLDRTTLGTLSAGSRVNLEGALRAGDPLGGHNVQGHVDGVGELVTDRPVGFSRVLGVSAPAELRRYIVEKGSVAVAGVSLTVSALTDDGFEVSLIPHTLEATTLGGLRPGDRVNLEADVVAKYVERLLQSYREAPPGPESAATIANRE